MHELLIAVIFTRLKEGQRSLSARPKPLTITGWRNWANARVGYLCNAQVSLPDEEYAALVAAKIPNRSTLHHFKTGSQTKIPPALPKFPSAFGIIAKCNRHFAVRRNCPDYFREPINPIFPLIF
jgi:hypothetical protein